MSIRVSKADNYWKISELRVPVIMFTLSPLVVEGQLLSTEKKSNVSQLPSWLRANGITLCISVHKKEQQQQK